MGKNIFQARKKNVEFHLLVARYDNFERIQSI